MVHAKEAKDKNAKHGLAKELKEKEESIKDYIDKLKRVQADFENYIKRTEKQRQEFARYANKNLLTKLLSIIDNFKHALKTIEKTETGCETIKGIKMIFDQLHRLLKEEGVRPIEAVGKKCDPYIHEVIKQSETDDEDGTILEEIQAGYFLHDLVLRPSKVIISTGGKK